MQKTMLKENLKYKSLMMTVGAIFMLGGLQACTPTSNVRGNIVEDYRLENVEVGVSNKTDVARALGSPTTIAPFDEDVWYYLGQETEKKGIFDPQVTNEKIVVAVFDDEGLLEMIQEMDPNRMDIPKVDRKTPTGGNNVTFLQQLLGNLGRFNTESGNP